MKKKHNKNRSRRTKQHTSAQQELQNIEQFEMRSASMIRNLLQILSVTPQDLPLLNITCLKQNNFGEFFIEFTDMHGNHIARDVLDHEVEIVRSALTYRAGGRRLKDGEFPFQDLDISSVVVPEDYSMRVRNLQQYFERQFVGWKHIPAKAEFQERKNDRRIEEKYLRMIWQERLFRRFREQHPDADEETLQSFTDELNTPYVFLKDKDHERAMSLGRPVKYDLLSVMIVSVYVLRDWDYGKVIQHILK